MDLYSRIADRIEREPALIGQALTTAQHWLREGYAPPARVRTWCDLLRAAQQNREGLAKLLSLLRDDSEEARRLKDFGPFAGILSREERREVFLSCAYSH